MPDTDSTVYKLHESINEFFTTERAYITRLQLTLSLFSSTSKPFLPPSTHELIFGGIQGLIGGNTAFMVDAESKSIAASFLSHVLPSRHHCCLSSCQSLKFHTCVIARSMDRQAKLSIDTLPAMSFLVVLCRRLQMMRDVQGLIWRAFCSSRCSGLRDTHCSLDRYTRSSFCDIAVAVKRFCTIQQTCMKRSNWCVLCS